MKDAIILGPYLVPLVFSSSQPLKDVIHPDVGPPLPGLVSASAVPGALAPRLSRQSCPNLVLVPLSLGTRAILRRDVGCSNMWQAMYVDMCVYLHIDICLYRCVCVHIYYCRETVLRP